MLVITGAAGFIGSCVASHLRSAGYADMLLVDDFNRTEKLPNLQTLEGCRRVDRSLFFTEIQNDTRHIDAVIHLGARTDTTEFDMDIFDVLNINYSKEMWAFCAEHHIPLIYASSAATYGDGAHGYDDSHFLVDDLKPLNPYGASKNIFDSWVLQQKVKPPFWQGLKFFNVYGPNEYHKGRMASVILHAYRQISETGKVKLFRSHKVEYKDGWQLRDFIYVKDVCSMIQWMLEQKPYSGIYNIGTGTARSFYDLAAATAQAMGKTLEIEWIDIPEDIRDKYQYFTEAKMDKLHAAGYAKDVYSLEAGITEYVQHFLMKSEYIR
ncbi:MAG: ADP-glyceromanno-heptose 6-epimerase [Chitinophagales bacterium]